MYYRVCSTLQDYGKYIPENEDIYKHVKLDKPFYQSIYMYSQEQVDAAKEVVEVTKNNKKIKRPKGIVGVTDVVTKKLVWDFDSKLKDPNERIKESQKDTQKLVERLMAEGIAEQNLGIYFSGGKGFHVEIETDSLINPKQFKKMTSHFAKDLKTYDSVVANPARIFRIAHTKHDSGYFKTRLAKDELFSLEVQGILDIAKEMYEPERLGKIILPQSFFSYAEEIEPKKENELEVNDNISINSFSLKNKPDNISNWKYALSQGLYKSGQKHNARMILAATYRGLGKSKLEAYYLLKFAADAQAKIFNEEKTPKEIIWKDLEDVYCELWNGGTYSEDNFPEEIKEFLIELDIPRLSDVDFDENLVVDVAEGFDNFYDYAVNIDNNRLNFGIPELDRILKAQKGHLIGLLAGPGIGKTSMALELLSNTSKDGCHSFFGSFDMNSSIMFQKLLQRETRLTDDEIYDVYRRNDQEQIKKFKEILKKHYENVTFSFKVGDTIKGLKASIAKREQDLGEKIGLVVIDYIELILSDKSDATQASAEAAQGLREIANSGKTVVVLLQPNKMSSKADEAPKTYNAAKGSSAIAQAVTSMMGCFRPGYDPEHPENDKYFGVAILKNRMGPLGTVYFNWHGPTGRISSMEDIERQELQEFLELKKLNKDDDGGL